MNAVGLPLRNTHEVRPYGEKRKDGNKERRGKKGGSTGSGKARPQRADICGNLGIRDTKATINQHREAVVSPVYFTRLLSVGGDGLTVTLFSIARLGLWVYFRRESTTSGAES